MVFGAFGGAYAPGSTSVTTAAEPISKLIEAERQLLFAYLQNRLRTLQKNEQLHANYPHSLNI